MADSDYLSDNFQQLFCRSFKVSPAKSFAVLRLVVELPDSPTIFFGGNSVVQNNSPSDTVKILPGLTITLHKLLYIHPRLAGSPAVPQPVELLEPAFALRPRPLRFRWARTEFPGEVFEQDLLFRMGQFVHGGLDFGERAHARKSSTPVQLRQAGRQVDKVAREE